MTILTQSCRVPLTPNSQRRESGREKKSRKSSAELSNSKYFDTEEMEVPKLQSCGDSSIMVSAEQAKCWRRGGDSNPR